jgi:hypothetical protein
MIGYPIFDVVLQLFILHGLSIDYDSLIVFLNSRSNVVPFNELCELLLTHEQRLLKYTHSVANLQPYFPSFPAALASATSQQLVSSQTHLATSTSSIFGQPPTTDKEFMDQFSAFLSS